MRRTLAGVSILVGGAAACVGCGGGADENVAEPPAVAAVATPLSGGYDYHFDSRPTSQVAFLDVIEQAERRLGWHPDTYITSRPEGVVYTVNDGEMACEYLAEPRTVEETVALFSTGFGPTSYPTEAAAVLVAGARAHLCPPGPGPNG